MTMDFETTDLDRKRCKTQRILTQHCQVEIMYLPGDRTVVHVTANGEDYQLPSQEVSYDYELNILNRPGNGSLEVVRQPKDTISLECKKSQMPIQEKRIVEAGGVKVKPQGRSEAWQVGSRLLWLNCGNGSQVLVGYAHNPEQQGVLMSLKSALQLGTET